MVITEQFIELKREEKSVRVNVVYSKRRTLGLEVKADAAVVVRAPDYLSLKQVKKFVSRNEKWIWEKYNEACNKIRERHELAREQVYCHNGMVPLLGNQFINIQVTSTGEKGYVTYQAKNEEDQITLYVETLHESVENIRLCVADFYKDLALKEITRIAEHYGRLMGVDFNQIKIKEQKTRWGSCSSKKNLNFNWKLMMMPRKMMEYVIVHELAHLIEMNHSSHFWNEVKDILPDYEDAVAWFKENSHKYIAY